MAALLNSHNPVKSKWHRHLHVYHHITRENQMEFKTINVYRRDTKSMQADLFTKNLGTADFWRHVSSTCNLSESELNLVAVLEEYPSNGIFS